MLRKVVCIPFTIALLILIPDLISQETIIQGQVKGFENQVIKLGYYEDFITSKEHWTNETRIKQGKFKLSIALTDDRQIILKIEDKKTNLFAEPGKVYNVNLRYDEQANRGKIHDKFLHMHFPFPNNENINIQIRKFNDSYRDFMSKNYRLFAARVASKEITNFTTKWEKIATKNKPFASNYIRYALANLEDIKGVSKKKLQEKYLKDQPVLYENKEYMNFLIQLFQTDFEQLTLTKRGTELLKAIMLDENLEKSITLLMEMKAFENPALAELYLIQGLFEVYHKKTVNQKSSIKLLSAIEDNGKNAHNKRTAKNVISHLSKLDEQKYAPEFNLLSSDDKFVKLSSMKDKVIYLNFWADWSIPSLRELKLIQKLHEKYGDKIEFISINVDEDSTLYRKIRRKNNYDWSFLHFGKDKEIKDKYELRSIPAYFIIGKNGKYIQAFAQGPLEVERRLYELSKE